jgi:hypothetical protein
MSRMKTLTVASSNIVPDVARTLLANVPVVLSAVNRPVLALMLPGGFGVLHTRFGIATTLPPGFDDNAGRPDAAPRDVDLGREHAETAELLGELPVLRRIVPIAFDLSELQRAAGHDGRA